MGDFDYLSPMVREMWEQGVTELVKGDTARFLVACDALRDEFNDVESDERHAVLTEVVQMINLLKSEKNFGTTAWFRNAVLCEVPGDIFYGNYMTHRPVSDGNMLFLGLLLPAFDGVFQVHLRFIASFERCPYPLNLPCGMKYWGEYKSGDVMGFLRRVVDDLDG